MSMHSCMLKLMHIIPKSCYTFIIKIHEVKKTDKTFLFRVLQITLLQKNTLQNWDSEFGYYISYHIRYEMLCWDRETQRREQRQRRSWRERRGGHPALLPALGSPPGTRHTLTHLLDLRSVGQRSEPAEDIRPILLFITSVSMSI